MSSTNKPGRRRTGRQLVVRLMVLLSAVAATLVVVPSAAHAADFESLRNYRTGRCLDSNAAGVAYTLPCNGGNYQNWRLALATSECDPDNCRYWYRIQNVATNRCLDNNTNGDLYTSPCQDPNYWQKWEINGWLDGSNRVVLNFLNRRTSRCLDANIPEGRPYTNASCYRDWPGYQDWKSSAQ